MAKTTTIISEYKDRIDSTALPRGMFGSLEQISLDFLNEYLFVSGHEWMFDIVGSCARAGVVIVRLASRAYSMCGLKV